MNLKKWLRPQGDRIAAIVCLAVGSVILLAGWLGMSGTPYPAEQMPYIVSGGIAGLVFVAVGATLWLSSDLRDEWTKLDRIEDALRTLADQSQPAAGSPPPEAIASDRVEPLGDPIEVTPEPALVAARPTGRGRRSSSTQLRAESRTGNGVNGRGV
jgi:hypothetical protein